MQCPQPQPQRDPRRGRPAPRAARPSPRAIASAARFAAAPAAAPPPAPPLAWPAPRPHSLDELLVIFAAVAAAAGDYPLARLAAETGRREADLALAAARLVGAGVIAEEWTAHGPGARCDLTISAAQVAGLGANAMAEAVRAYEAARAVMGCGA